MTRPPLKKQIAVPLVLAAVFGLAWYLLYQFSWELPKDTTDESERMSHAANWWAWKLASIACLMSAALVAVRALNELAFLLFRKRKGYDAPALMRDLFSLVLYVTTGAVILRYTLDLSFAALLPGSALLGIILGLALQDTLGNLFSGISLHADKPFQVGDVITVGKHTGSVMSITWRAVKIKTFSNHIVLVSNTSIAKESIEVCPQNGQNARLVFFSAAYTDSPVKVIHAVREAVREAENVLRYITPVVRIRNMGDSGVEYEVKYWLSDYSRYNDTDALVRQRIWYAFRRNGFTFPFPTRTIHMEPPAAHDGDGRDTETVAALLSAVDIFSPLAPDELNALASAAANHVFAPGETIIRAGDDGASMFVVSRGSVDVRVDSNGTPRTINQIGEGGFFGEMALFTGEPRTANVVAAEETEVLEIGHEAMRGLFKTNPPLVESLSHAINERRAGLLANASVAPGDEDTPAGLLSRIKRFFGLD